MTGIVKRRDPMRAIVDFVSRKPLRTSALIGCLTVLVVILIVAVSISRASLKGCEAKRKFLTAGIGNFEMAGNNPLWWYGNGDAGGGGVMSRDTTPQQLSAYIPRYRRSVQLEQARRRRARARAKLDAMHTTETMEGSPAVSAVSPCGELWDPAAVAEIQGLSVAQGTPGVAFGEDLLQKAIKADPTPLDSTTVATQIARLGRETSW